jgi:cysteine desulfurase
MALKFPIFLDNHSTTPVDPRVLEAMLPYFTQDFGNASSKHHRYGWVAEAAVGKARKQVASLIGAESNEIIFTSGATESINLALKGVAEGYNSRGGHIITAATEHRAVLDTLDHLQRLGYQVTGLPVDSTGLVAPEVLQNSLTKQTLLVSIMVANNEIGTIAPIELIGRICRERGILFHTDAAQAVGKIPIDVTRLNVDLLSFSAHKMYGPKGVGALFVRKSVPRFTIVPQIDGGGHERGLRSGTLNVPGIVGFGAAAELARLEMSEESRRVVALRDRLIKGLFEQLDNVTLNGHPSERLPNNANLTFTGVRADRLIADMRDIAVSTGSACSSASPQPSHVLRAIGLDDEGIASSVRFGLGRFTTEEEIDFAIERVETAVHLARTTSHTFHLASSS